jgi:homoserine dehydrogenase
MVTAAAAAASTATQTPLRVGIVGGGTVGGGVWELLQSHPALVQVVKIVVRSLHKPRDYAAPTNIFTSDINDVVANKDIDCVVEVMGGTDTAKTVVLQALQAGQAVVTANKALLAEHLTTVATTQTTAQRPLMYEAAVCGGIPIINLLQTAYAGDTVTSIAGILNGTTNYMLSKMEAEGVAYHDVLKEAQDLGYAEADPTADVEGHDARAKLALLAHLAFGGITVPDVTTIPCQGISQITPVDFGYAKTALQSTIKLVGTAHQVDKDVVAMYVAPVMLPYTHTLATISGPGNAVTVTSQNLGPCLYTGPGAGRYPTANSIVADILRIAHQPSYAPAAFDVEKGQSVSLQTDYSAMFYVRIMVKDGTSSTTPLPSMESLQDWAQKCALPVKLQALTVPSGVSNAVAVVTDGPCTRRQMDTFVANFPPSEFAVLAMPKL